MGAFWLQARGLGPDQEGERGSRHRGGEIAALRPWLAVFFPCGVARLLRMSGASFSKHFAKAFLLARGSALQLRRQLGLVERWAWDAPAQDEEEEKEVSSAVSSRSPRAFGQNRV
jgi:hypothetical protein